ncbi:unnamed protein product [Spirodela intermedia]|uniref:[RNA-polymerase]-subunit kinase n=1 Tax=Spirodela intermedia TaxID=51605 RepID=A0A7I8JPB1_SPIIN|nr:unnamed protein product [Spirodela intermedia]CAA6671996.1 unnamed protein product [Spirodela intermedia]
MGDGVRAVAAQQRGGGGPNRPAWLQQYELIGKIGRGRMDWSSWPRVSRRPTEASASPSRNLSNPRKVTACFVKFHMKCRQLVNVHINHVDMSLYLAFDYAEHDLYEIIRHHREKLSHLWQLLNGLNYLHKVNWIIHRDLKPSNILGIVMGEGDEHGIVKIADFGLARIYHFRWTIELSCSFFPLLDSAFSISIQDFLGRMHIYLYFFPHHDQLDKIFKVLGHPTPERWPTLVNLPYWQMINSISRDTNSDNPGLHTYVHLPPKSPAYDLLSKMLEYDPRKRITASQALEHEYFRIDPQPGRNALVPTQPGEKVVNYQQDQWTHTTDFEGTASVQSSQPASSGNAVGSIGLGLLVIQRGPRPMPMVGMQRMPASGMTAYGIPSQADMSGLNPGGIPIQRAAAAQAAHQQKKRPWNGMQNQGYPPQQKSRRF